MPIETKTGYQVTLSIAQRAVLAMLAQRGRRQILDHSTLSKQARDGLDDLVIKGLMIAIKLFGRDAAEYVLTDLGAQVVDQIYASQKQSQQLAEFAKKAEDA